MAPCCRPVIQVFYALYVPYVVSLFVHIFKAAAFPTHDCEFPIHGGQQAADVQAVQERFPPPHCWRLCGGRARHHLRLQDDLLQLRSMSGAPTPILTLVHTLVTCNL